MSSQMRMVWPRPYGRKPQNDDRVTFRKSKEFKLRDRVIQQINIKKTPCLFEMSSVFTCLKDNNFNEKECFDEVKEFRNCYMDHMKEMENIKFRKNNPGKVCAGVDKLLSAEVNALIAKYKK